MKGIGVNILKLIDTHCHLSMPQFKGQVEAIIDEAKAVGVERFVSVAFDEASSEEVVSLTDRYKGKGVYASIGVHPHDSKGVAGGIPESLKGLAEKDRVVAIGETGLDYHYDHSPRGVQREVFALHINWAKEAKKPLIVHIREAYRDALGLLKSEGADEVGGIIHCFSGEKNDAFAAIDMGFYVSFAGPLTYPNNLSLKEIAALLPVERLFCETDSPYLAPQAHRGKTNKPAYVRYVYEALSEAKGIGLDELARRLWDNAKALFRWEG